MEEEKTGNPGKFKPVMIPRELADQLKKLNKGSYTQTIKYLMNESPGERVIDQIKLINSEILKIQEMLERVVQVNGLRI